MIDTHCHLNDAEAFPDPASVLVEARAAGLEGILVVGVDEDSSWRALELAERFAEVFAIVGWHPNYAAGFRSERLDPIRAMLAHPKAVALGEIGLDFHWTYATLEEQERALFDQLDLAAELGAPVVFHCREAYPALLDRLEARPRRPYLFHCFAGGADDARRAMELDAYFGVDGPITYKKANDLRAVVATLPGNRLVIETDSPYLTPAPYRGKPNRPAYVRFVAQALAEVRGIPTEDCVAATTANARRFFGLNDLS